MTDVNKTTQAAGAALEGALNAVGDGEGATADDAVEVACKLIMLSSGFLRAVCGDEYVRGFLEEGLRDLDKPPILAVVKVTKKQTQH